MMVELEGEKPPKTFTVMNQKVRNKICFSHNSANKLYQKVLFSVVFHPESNSWPQCYLCNLQALFDPNDFPH
jgi:hypothetical protein